DLGAERRLVERHRDGDAQVVAVEREHGVRADRHRDDEVTSRRAARAGAPLAPQPDLLAVAHARGDAGLDRAVLDLERDFRTLDGLPERQRHGRREVGALLRARSGAESGAATAVEEAAEDVLEAAAAAEARAAAGAAEHRAEHI